MTTSNSLTCPFCGTDIAEGTIKCPNCHENLSAWTRMRYSCAIDYNEALALAREGRLDEARAKLSQALASKESFAPAHVLLAKICAQQERWAEAQHHAERARELLPDDERTQELARAIAISAAAAVEKATALEAVAMEQAATESQDRQCERMADLRVLGPHWLGRYQQDIVRAFAVGVGLTTMMALLISRLSGKRPD